MLRGNYAESEAPSECSLNKGEFLPCYLPQPDSPKDKTVLKHVP